MYRNPSQIENYEYNFDFGNERCLKESSYLNIINSFSGRLGCKNRITSG